MTNSMAEYQRQMSVDLWDNPYDDLLTIIHPDQATKLLEDLAEGNRWKFEKGDDKFLGIIEVEGSQYGIKYDTEGQGLNLEQFSKDKGPYVLLDKIKRAVVQALSKKDQ